MLMPYEHEENHRQQALEFVVVKKKTIFQISRSRAKHNTKPKKPLSMEQYMYMIFSLVNLK